jgi:colanic acid biosynthesis protein WcaH
MRLDAETFGTVVANAPLVSMDLLVKNSDGGYLVGLRTNPPAQGTWFVPGGRVRKGETLERAFGRITLEELGQAYPLGRAHFLGVFEHFYPDDFRGRCGSGTHYVVLAYVLDPLVSKPSLPANQHAQFAWLTPGELLGRSDVHQYTRRYFGAAGPTSGNPG